MKHHCLFDEYVCDGTNPDCPSLPMNTERLLATHDTLCEKARAIMVKKNHDYAGASGETPFRNFEACELLGITTTEQGFLVRMTDKFRRLVTFVVDGELKVEGEMLDDTLLDLINYCVLFAAHAKAVREGKSGQSAPASPETGAR